MRLKKKFQFKNFNFLQILLSFNAWKLLKRFHLLLLLNFSASCCEDSSIVFPSPFHFFVYRSVHIVDRGEGRNENTTEKSYFTFKNAEKKRLRLFFLTLKEKFDLPKKIMLHIFQILFRLLSVYFKIYTCTVVLY